MPQKESSDVRRMYRYLPLLALPLYFASYASAQSSFDVNIGFGTARVGSNGSGIHNASCSNAFGSCVPSSGDTFCHKTSGLGGLFLGLGGDVRLQKHLTSGAEVSRTP